MRDLGVMFSAKMVVAMIEGRKQQTRRLRSSPIARLERGDRIYVRETFRPWTGSASRKTTVYSADGEWFDHGSGWRGKPEGITWCTGQTPAIHMPRWRSRLTLLVLDVRFEPLRCISGHDARCEGIELIGNGRWRDYLGVYPEGVISARESYSTLWDSLRPKEGQRWRDNPEIVAITFHVIPHNIDDPETAAIAARFLGEA